MTEKTLIDLLKSQTELLRQLLDRVEGLESQAEGILDRINELDVLCPSCLGEDEDDDD